MTAGRGGYLEVRVDAEGVPRTYLLGREVPDGAVLEVLLEEGRWLRGGYDHGTVDGGEWHPALLVGMAGGSSGYLQLRASTLWRWPERLN